MGIGAGSFLASSFAVVQALVSPEEISNAVGFMSIGKLRRVRLLEYPNMLTLHSSGSWDRCLPSNGWNHLPKYRHYQDITHSCRCTGIRYIGSYSGHKQSRVPSTALGYPYKGGSRDCQRHEHCMGPTNRRNGSELHSLILFRGKFTLVLAGIPTNSRLQRKRLYMEGGAPAA